MTLLTPGINIHLKCVKVRISDFVITCINLFYCILMSHIPKIDLLNLYLAWKGNLFLWLHVYFALSEADVSTRCKKIQCRSDDLLTSIKLMLHRGWIGKPIWLLIIHSKLVFDVNNSIFISSNVNSWYQLWDFYK